MVFALSLLVHALSLLGSPCLVVFRHPSPLLACPCLYSMNRPLLDPFEIDYPEIIEEYLVDGHSTTMAFNTFGTLLAIGTHDGTVAVWDFETRSVASRLCKHKGAITALR